MGAIRHQLGRYRPLVVVVVTALLLVVAPTGNDGSGSSTVAAGDRATGGGSSPIGRADPNRTPRIDGATADAGARRGAADDRGPTANAAAGGAGPAAAASTSGAGEVAVGDYPGIATPDALANPNCDPKTGRVRVPTKFAPECVRPWPAGADNGGATTMGVTADAIKLIVYDTSNDQDRAANRKVIAEFLEIFNHHYELWGRKLDIEFYARTGTDEVAQRADAVEVANKEPFMVTSYMTFGSASPTVFSTELAHRGVIAWDPTTHYDQTHAQPGLRWGSHDSTLNGRYAGEYVGKRLTGHNAKWAGDVAMQTQPRVFGLVHDQEWDVEGFKVALTQHGGKIAGARAYDPADRVGQQDRASTIIARMKDAGVNNVINATDIVFNTVLTTSATSQNYFPEWTLTGWSATDTTIAGQLADDQQWAHAFGFGHTPMQTEDPLLFDYNLLYKWEYGRDSPDLALTGQIWQFAKSALGGLQLAGPNLTVETFGAALFAMKPKAGFFCGCGGSIGVAFGRSIPAYPGDKYAANADISEKWFDANVVATNEIGTPGPGGIRFPNNGKRYILGEVPSGEPDMFNPANGPMAYEDWPPQDQDPSYPHSAE